MFPHLSLLIVIISGTVITGIAAGLSYQAPTHSEEDTALPPEDVFSLPHEDPSPAPFYIGDFEFDKIPPPQSNTAAIPSTPSTETPSATPTPVTPPTTPQPSPAIIVNSLPATVGSGQSFTVEWRIQGPSELQGADTTLTATHKASTPGASSSSNTKQSFGSFSVPATFTSTLSFGGPSGSTIELLITAEINGRTISEARTIYIR